MSQPPCARPPIDTPTCRRFACALAAACLALLLPAGARAVEIPWGPSALIQGGYTSPIAVDWADIDRDGRPDIVAASWEFGYLLWWRNLGGGAFAPALISGASSLTDVEVADLDGDGDLDIVATAAGTQDAVGWWQNDGTPGDGGWIFRVIATGFNDALHVAVADLDRDGDLDVAAAAFAAAEGDIAVALNANGAGTSWTYETVDTAADSARWIVAGDVDGDGDVDLAGAFSTAPDYDAFAWWDREAGTWTRHDVASGFVGSAVGLCDVDRNGSVDLVAAATNLGGAVGWYAGGVWTPHLIADDLPAWALSTGDLDLDGDCDVAYAAYLPDQVGWLENVSGTGSTWALWPAPGTADGAAAVAPGDFDHDGDPDLVAVAESSDEILGWANLTIHRSALYPEHLSLGAGEATRTLVAADLDGDRDLDLLGGDTLPATVDWWENLGSGVEWTRRTITTLFGPLAVAAADLDQDGLNDAVAAGSDGIKWWRNGGGGGGWTTNTVTATLANVQALQVADLDRDGDPDLVGGSFSAGVKWYANAGHGGGWTEAAVSGTYISDADRLALGDLDRDGAIDVVVAAYDTISWHRNQLATGGGFGSDLVIAEELGNPDSLALGDLDADGDLDVGGVERATGAASWWENVNGDASAWSPAQPIAAGIDTPRVLVFADLDLDGDLDVALGAENGGTSASLLAWYENLDHATTWSAHTLSTEMLRPAALVAADLDGDGAPDLALGNNAHEPYWWPNRGGQTAFETTATAPPELAPGTRDDILSIAIAHRGRSGDSDERAREIALRFTDEALVPLTSAQANARIQTLAFYVDDGDGVFEPATEQLLREVPDLVLIEGGEIYPLADAPQLEMSPGGECRVFVTVDLTAGAPVLDPSPFRVIHREASGRVEDRNPGIPLRIEDPRDVAAAVVPGPDVIFADGFESGYCDAWDLEVPGP